MIPTRFDYLYNLGHNQTVMLQKTRLHEIPRVGEVVNLLGYPFRVVEVGWSIPHPEDVDDEAQYAFVTVQKASEFTFVVGDQEF